MTQFKKPFVPSHIFPKGQLVRLNPGHASVVGPVVRVLFDSRDPNRVTAVGVNVIKAGYMLLDPDQLISVYCDAGGCHEVAEIAYTTMGPYYCAKHTLEYQRLFAASSKDSKAVKAIMGRLAGVNEPEEKSLEDQVTDLRSELDELKEELAECRRQIQQLKESIG